jgi:hypothetical protein
MPTNALTNDSRLASPEALAADPLATILIEAANRAEDAAVRCWLLALLRHGERSTTATGIVRKDVLTVPRVGRLASGKVCTAAEREPSGRKTR